MLVRIYTAFQFVRRESEFGSLLCAMLSAFYCSLRQLILLIFNVFYYHYYYLPGSNPKTRSRWGALFGEEYNRDDP